MNSKTDVLVIGGGIAGIAVATQLSKQNIHVTLVEESAYLGGKTAYQTQILSSSSKEYDGKRGFELVDDLLRTFSPCPVDVLLNHSVIGLYGNRDISVVHNGQIKRITADIVVIATGATEKPLPFEGWTLPGIMTIEAAQHFINRDLVLPGKTGIIVGQSSFTSGAVELFQKAGIFLQAIVTIGENSSEKPYMDVPVLDAAEIEAIAKNNKVDSLKLTFYDEEEKIFPTDFICTDSGRIPVLETAAIFDCEIEYREDLAQFVPIYNENMETTVPNVFVAGASAGIKTYDDVFITARLVVSSIANRITVFRL